MQKRQASLEEEENLQQSLNALICRRTSSLEVDPNHFFVEEEDLDCFENEEEEKIRHDGFSMSLLKKIFELRIEVIYKKIENLESQEKPLRK